MVQYRRNFIPGGTYFFTVTLADRTSPARVDNVDALRMAFRVARHERPFTIDAIVVLPADWAGAVQESTMDFGERRA
jgi:putative transposase